jgi:pSer/pThr/pTyr-binding forkhead associated (FHA) protein
VVPPAPSTGRLPGAASPLAATVLSPLEPSGSQHAPSAPTPASAAGRGSGTQRPTAPEMSFAQRSQAPQVPPSAAGAASTRCASCGGTNRSDVRFCVACGNPLERSTSKQAQTPAIAPGRIVDIRVSGESPGQSSGSPIVAPRPVARLVLIGRNGNEGLNHPLGESTDIGRTEGDVIIADDAYMSPRHARIVQREGAFFLHDLGSTNGLFVRIPFELAGRAQRAPDAANEVQPTPSNDDANRTSSEAVLEDQDLFLVGQQVLRFDVVKHAEEGFGFASENGTLLFGAPATPRYARLSQRTVEGIVRDVFHIRKTEMVIGRESGDIVFTDDPFLSRRHAVVRAHTPAGAPAGSPRRFTLQDLGSSNGTFLQASAEVRLRHGDHFRIGQQLFRFDVDAAATRA